MKFLINNKEYSAVLARRAKMKKLRSVRVTDPVWKKSSKFAKELDAMLRPSFVPGVSLVPNKTADQNLILESIESVVAQDLNKWIDSLASQASRINQTTLMKYINANYGQFDLQERKLIWKMFERSGFSTMTKQILQAYSDVGMALPRDSVDEQDPEKLFIRNTVNNESLLCTRMENNLPFMFMDNGYTNFLESGKKWFRLCNDHIHDLGYKKGLDPKRMKNFARLPEPWRSDGHDVVVVEPSQIQCRLFGINPQRWREQVEAEIKNNLNSYKRIVFREKVDKKIRQNFFQFLMDEDVYCVVNYNSNAAVESIWAGVPVITMGDHITNRVSVRNIDQINNLERPDLNRWLRYLSYRQYTLEEIADGTARRIMEEVLGDV